ncbi:ice-binding family protein [Demequina sp.]|uniref:ice-binding family protein n=1 Tax=Demequina sp. TaxID=2050685 RepID=UPI0025B86450|nr:ice-binding family protein [Demequina sp.]
MSFSSSHHRLAGRHFARASIIAVVSSAVVLVGSGTANALPTAVPLGTAGSFAVLAGAGVTATGPNTLNGDIGTFPTTSITGSGSITVNGTDHGGDGVTQTAKTDLGTAYDVAAGQGPTSPIVADLAGQALTSGVYNSSSQINLTGALTLDAAGDPDAVFVFQAGSDLIVGPSATVSLTNGAQACNVFWQVTSSASLDTGASFTGTIMALTSITAGTGATVQGRLLARNGTVTLDTNTITSPVCAAPSAGPSTTPVGGVQTGDGSTVGAAGGADSTFVAAGVVTLLASVGVVFAVLTRRRLRTV